jgi:hypothetical protein
VERLSENEETILPIIKVLQILSALEKETALALKLQCKTRSSIFLVNTIVETGNKSIK